MLNTKFFVLFTGVFLSVFSSYSYSGYSYANQRKTPKQQFVSPVNSDSALVQALNSKRNVTYLEAANLVVVELLPDDTSGREHQKFVTKLSTGQTVQIISNLDMCQKIPVRVGDVVSVGGEFIWTKFGGLVHWVHYDPRKIRKDGYILYNGNLYCR